MNDDRDWQTAKELRDLGLLQRMGEIAEVLADAGHPLCNENGHIHLLALRGLVADRDRLRGALTELAALVRGECPALLDEDRGGNSRLDMSIDAALGPNV